MRNTLIAVTTAVIMAVCAASPGRAAEDGAPTIRWIEFPSKELEVRGLAWFAETSPVLHRLPDRFKEKVRPPVWAESGYPSGGRIRFASDTTALYIRAKGGLTGSRGLSVVGRRGIDLFVNGMGWRPAWPRTKDLHAMKFFGNAERKRREFTIYLPTYSEVEIAALGFDTDAQIWPAETFAVEKPVVYYGTSITQGGCASRVGNAWPAMVGRSCNVDFVNLGFSGQGKGEQSVAEIVAEVDASCFVMDWSQNNEEIAELEVEIENAKIQSYSLDI